MDTFVYEVVEIGTENHMDPCGIGMGFRILYESFCLLAYEE